MGFQTAELKAYHCVSGITQTKLFSESESVTTGGL